MYVENYDMHRQLIVYFQIRINENNQNEFFI